MSSRLQSYLDIIFKSTIAKARRIKLQTLYFASLKEFLIKKKSFKPKTHKFFIVYSLFLQRPVF